MAIKTQRMVIPARPETVEEREVGVICDLCGRDSTDCSGEGWADRSRSQDNVDEIMICRQLGYDYSDVEQSFVIDKVDMCNACWESHFLPWLASFKVTPRRYHRDYREFHD
jgi:hypothetical protein